jgi:hypothetical protein
LVKSVLNEWLQLATAAHASPIPLHTLVPRAPDIIAATDA